MLALPRPGSAQLHVIGGQADDAAPEHTIAVVERNQPTKLMQWSSQHHTPGMTSAWIEDG